MTAPTAHELRALKRYLQELEGKLDHMHADLAALRERASIARPECYPHLDEDDDDAAGDDAGEPRRRA
jgi:hypothetical protein